jgi:HD-GYP domain-containing protein (c-di-GMP phosphodiesterase class II)
VPGMVVARPIPLPQNPYRCLLPRDREIPMDLVPRLQRLGILEVWVRHQDLDFLESLIDEGLEECQRELYRRVRRNFEAIMRGSSVELDLVGFQSSIGELFGFLKGSSSSNILLQKLDAFDNYLMSHSSNTCYLALLLGLKLERYLTEERSLKTAHDAKDLHLLGLGCLLHDVGKMLVPGTILHKSGRLEPAELAEMRRHTTYGYEMVRGSVPASAAQVVLNHHQRWDGSGYPPRTNHLPGDEMPPLSGRQIPIFSRITMLADIYDAATSQRCYSGAKLPAQALYEMQHGCQGFFDPVVEAMFYRIVPPFPIGQVVTLSNGVEAAVVDFNPDCPTRPKVRCLRTPAGQRFGHPSLEEIDLSLYPDVDISLVDGQDVRPFSGSHCESHYEPSYETIFAMSELA